MKANLSDRFTGGNVQAPSLKGRAKKNRATGAALDMSILFDNTKAGQAILVRLFNKDTEDHRIALFHGMLKSTAEVSALAGVSVDALATDGIVLGDASNQKLICSCKNLDVIQRYISAHPTRISSIQLSADNESQWFLPITISKFGITRNYGSQEITPNTYLDPANPNKTLVTIDNLKHFQVDDQTVLDFKIGAGRELQISLVLGESMDAATTLDEAAHALLD